MQRAQFAKRRSTFFDHCNLFRPSGKQIGRWLGCSAVLCLSLSRAIADDSAGVEFFEKKVRPILVARCQQCHGEKKQESDLRLDSRSGITLGGARGPAVAPGKPNDSLLISAIEFQDKDLQMPPKGKLPDEQIAVLRRWVEMNVPWPEEAAPQSRPFDLQARKAAHWAWKPLLVQQPPGVKQVDWPRRPVDRFVLARLEQEGLVPAADCDRRTLIRRVYLDLIGLPPTPAEIAAFLADDSPQAFEKVVDRLLASPRYGERWARHWFDLVRYAETYGHEADYAIPHAWQYRDYVIRALNADVPYDQFVREHIAGDLLPQPRLHTTDGYNESIIGTGWWFMHEQTHAPTDLRQHEADRVDNQIDVLTKTFLGLTVGCARCHDHKFDAISTQDYYALAGFVKSARFQEAYLDPHGKIARIADQLQKTHALGSAALSQLLPQPSEQAASAFARWLRLAGEIEAGKSLEAVAAENLLSTEQVRRWMDALRKPELASAAHPLYAWAKLKDAAKMSEAGRALGRQLREINRDRSSASGAVWLAERGQRAFENWFFTGWAFGNEPSARATWDVSRAGVRAFEPGMIDSARLSKKLCGVARSPTFTISARQLHVRAAGRKARLRLVIDNYMIDQYTPLLFNGTIAAVDTKGQFQWITIGGDLGMYLGERAYLSIEDDGDCSVAVDEVVHSDAPPPPDPACLLMAAALEAGKIETREALADAYGQRWKESLAQWHAGKLDADHSRFLNWVLQSGLIDTAATAEKLVEIRHQLESHGAPLPAPMTVLAMADGTGQDERVFTRGKHQSLGLPVARRFLEAIDGTQQPPIRSGSGRLELAQRIIDPANPFVSRTAVNRIWHLLFSHGLTATVDNLGVQGEPPTHPELLDWLADEFVRDGWSQKRLIRQLVLSRTYQLSSRPDDTVAEARDPANRLWHRAAVRRLEGETIRDCLLAVSGSLNDTMHGPSVPIHLTAFMDGKGRPEKSGPLDGNGRRSLYIEVRRNFLSPMMLAFDTPIPFTAVPRRSVSNVPAQALIMLNDPLVIELARRWAERLLADANQDSPTQRINKMYETALGRPPTEEELAAATEFVEQQADSYGLPLGERAHAVIIWSDLAHVLFNHKEFVLRN